MKGRVAAITGLGAIVLPDPAVPARAARPVVRAVPTVALAEISVPDREVPVDLVDLVDLEDRAAAWDPVAD